MSSGDIFAPQFINRRFVFADLAAVDLATHGTNVLTIQEPPPVATQWFVTFISAAFHCPVNTGAFTLVFTSINTAGDVSNELIAVGGATRFWFFTPDSAVKNAATYDNLLFFIRAGVVPDGFVLNVFYYLTPNPFLK